MNNPFHIPLTNAVIPAISPISPSSFLILNKEIRYIGMNKKNNIYGGKENLSSRKIRGCGGYPVTTGVFEGDMVRC